MCSGCGSLIADKVLRLPDNSPFWQHFTRGLLLCFVPIIQYVMEKVNRNLQTFAAFYEK